MDTNKNDEIKVLTERNDQVAVVSADGLTFVAFPGRDHTNTSARHDDGCIGKTQRVYVFKEDVLLRVELHEYWYQAGRLFTVTTRELPLEKVMS